MNERLVIIGLSVTLAVGFLAGCAGTPSRDAGPVEITYEEVRNLPQVVLSGGPRANMKALAMGRARSHGWHVTNPQDDRMVAAYPLTPNSPFVPALFGQGQVPPAGARIEVTTFFVNRPNQEVAVATRADLEIPAADAGSQPQRTDCTSALQSLLLTSLSSLQTAWVRSGARVAHAAPPIRHRPVNTQGTTPTDTTAAPATVTQPDTSAPQPAEPTQPQADSQGTQPVNAAPALPVGAAAPAGNDSLMQLPLRPGEDWTAFAEQYARTQGCKVGGSGAKVLEKQADGEIIMVPCEGSDGLRVRCQNGVCTGLL